MLITCAWTEQGQRLVRVGQPDIGKPPVFEPCRDPRALVWLLNGTPDDVARAQEWVTRFSSETGRNKDGRAFTFDVDEADPLVKSRQKILALA